jgi:hypothetical protein
MCRNIKALFNFDPPVTEAQIRAAEMQYVHKVSGFNKPSKTNEGAFQIAVDEITAATRDLLNSLVTKKPPKLRLDESMMERKSQVYPPAKSTESVNAYLHCLVARDKCQRPQQSSNARTAFVVYRSRLG